MAKTTKTSSRRKSPVKKSAGRKYHELRPYQEQYVVVDTASHFIFIGRLQEISDHFITLEDSDAHDGRESPSINEKYIMDSKKYGVRCNRRRIHIRLEEVISISLLEDVIDY
ncbi:hypothetical protein ACFL9T_03800 [Thermodesulfobacteriota bacterium]